LTIRVFAIGCLGLEKFIQISIRTAKKTPFDGKGNYVKRK